MQERRNVPQRREGIRQKITIDGVSIHYAINEYPDGTPAEIWITASHKYVGPTCHSLLELFSTAVSIGLQYGVPLETFEKLFVFTKFPPEGLVQGHDQIAFASSIVDAVFRDIMINYAGKTEYIQKES